MDLSPQGPERDHELFSVEVDLDELDQMLSQIIKELGLILPAVARKPMFLTALELDRWVVVTAKTTQRQFVRLWFRLEDIDVAEVVVTK